MTIIPDFDNRIEVLGLTEDQADHLTWLMTNEPMDIIKIRFDTGLIMLNRGKPNTEILAEMSANAVYLKARYSRRQDDQADNPLEVKKKAEEDPWAVKRKPKTEAKPESKPVSKASEVHAEKNETPVTHTPHPADHDKPFERSVEHGGSAIAKSRHKSRLDAIRQELLE